MPNTFIWVKAEAIGTPNNQLCEVLAYVGRGLRVRLRGSGSIKMIEVRDVVGISFQFEDPDQSSSSVSIRFDKTATISTTDNDEEPKPKAKTRTLSPFVAIQPVEVHGGAASRAEFIDVLSIVRFNRHSNELEMVTGKVYRVTEDDLRRVLERLDQIGMIPLLD